VAVKVTDEPACKVVPAGGCIETMVTLSCVGSVGELFEQNVIAAAERKTLRTRSAGRR
jgi:hypothetical protein